MRRWSRRVRNVEKADWGTMVCHSLRKCAQQPPPRGARPSPSPREARTGRGPGRGVPHDCLRSRRGGSPPLPGPLLRSERRRGRRRSPCGRHELSQRLIGGPPKPARELWVWLISPPRPASGTRPGGMGRAGTIVRAQGFPRGRGKLHPRAGALPVGCGIPI